jgi:PEP-CTERM motif
VVEQTGLSAEGLDFTATASTSPVPEPSTLLMLGTGLVGSAGALFRRMRK